jgi:hypothetical protein
MFSVYKVNYKCPACNQDELVVVGRLRWKCKQCETQLRLKSNRFIWRSNLLILLFSIFIPTEIMPALVVIIVSALVCIPLFKYLYLKEEIIINKIKNV